MWQATQAACNEAARPNPTGKIGELISCHILSAIRPAKADLTVREREVAAHLMQGLTSKQIGKALGISHRTVEIYRARLMHKGRRKCQHPIFGRH